MKRLGALLESKPRSELGGRCVRDRATRPCSQLRVGNGHVRCLLRGHGEGEDRWDLSIGATTIVAAHDETVTQVCDVEENKLLETTSWHKTLRYWDFCPPTGSPVGFVPLADQAYDINVIEPTVVVGLAEIIGEEDANVGVCVLLWVCLGRVAGVRVEGAGVGEGWEAGWVQIADSVGQ